MIRLCNVQLHIGRNWQKLISFSALSLLLVLPAVGKPIDITPVQRQKLKSMARESRTIMETQRLELGRGRWDLIMSYVSYKMDESKAQDAMHRIGDAQKKLLNEQYDNQIKIRGVLNADQFAQFQKKVAQHMPKVDMEIAIPFEEKVIEYGLAAVNSDRANAVESAKCTNRLTREITSRISKSVEQLWDLYAKYNLDTKAARALNNSIHHDQKSLTWLSFKRQQAIHKYLTQDQFNQFLQGIERAYKEHPGELYDGNARGSGPRRRGR